MVKLNLSKAIEALKNGEVIVYPTDTLYGLGADIFSDSTVQKIYRIKNRPCNIPLSVAVSDLNELKKIAFTNDYVECLAKSFLPGKLTLILKKKKCVSNVVTAGHDKVAVRIPNDKIALKLLSKFGPLTATSANIHNKETPSNINDIKMQFKEKDIAVYLDIGELKGYPSTIVDITDKKIKILREGAITKKDILDAI